jgi:hypothetical protein
LLLLGWGYLLSGGRRGGKSGFLLWPAGAAARASRAGDGGAAPLVKEVKPGEHTVEVTADGYFPVTVKARAVDGEMVPVDVQLKPKPALLEVDAPSGSHVAIDGRPLGAAPVHGAEVPAGKHLIAITHSGRVPYVRELELSYGKTSTIDADLRATAQRQASRFVLAGAGLLLVGTAVAGAMTWSADSDASTLAGKLAVGGQTPADLARYDDLRARRDSRLRTTEVLGGVTAVVAVTGALLYLLDDPSAESTAPVRDDAAPGGAAKKQIEIEPMMGPSGGAGVTIRGSF